METLLGIAFQDFVIVCADMNTAHSVLVMKSDENKVHKLSDHLVMAVVGDSGDTTQFAEYIAKNIQLYKMRNGYGLSPNAAATYTRRNLADYLRSKTPYQVNILIGGFDKEVGPQLFFIDYLAAMVQVPYSFHGYGGLFCSSIMDRYYRRDMNPDEGYDLVKKCVREIQKRLILNLPNFKVVVVDKEGVKSLPNITVSMLNVQASV